MPAMPAPTSPPAWTPSGCRDDRTGCASAVSRRGAAASGDGKFRQWFEQEYEFIRSDARFRSLTMPGVADVHDGYFATTPKGVPKDITFGRDTKDAESAFERIMQNKEKLLSFEEPLRFIFSHSALVEGWDNPNVFTICNLQDGKSEMRKRQQIGRGLRLPVMENGERCRVDDINMLTVIAYEEFSSMIGIGDLLGAEFLAATAGTLSLRVRRPPRRLRRAGARAA